jgi:deazaflavin-dependent oxidoreductase (nitroreductase family)
MVEEITDAHRLPDWMQEHMQKYLATKGEDGHIWRGVPTLLLTTTGRRSGNPIMIPLIYGQQDDQYIVVGSKGGNPAHPYWYLNLVAQPMVQVQVAADRFVAKARTATAEERPAIWELMVKIWPAYDEYQSQTDRAIPLVILDRA